MSKTKGSSIDLMNLTTKRSTANKTGFTLYGLTKPVEFDDALRVSDYVSAQAPKKYGAPSDAANKFYDKTVAQAFDKFRSQEIHLQRL